MSSAPGPDEFPDPTEVTSDIALTGDQPAPAASVETVMERPHPLTPVVKGWMGMVAFVLWFSRDALDRIIGKDTSGSFETKDLLIIVIVMTCFLLATCVVGFFSWKFTRFLVDDEQLRIEKNFIQHTSDRIPFTKIQSVDVIQPMSARLLGLAKLHIDVGAGEGKTIEYLTRERAHQLREYLIDRAHGVKVTTVQAAEHHAHLGIGDDVVAGERVLLRATPQRLMITALLSTTLVSLIITMAIAIGASLWFGEPLGIIGVGLPLGSGIAAMISKHLVKQWNYALVATDSAGHHAVKITRGMTSITSQTVPVDRIQSISIVQNLLWRPFGLYRVSIEVLGNTSGDDKGEDSDVLLPAGTWDEVMVALNSIWPGFTLEGVERRRPPRVARWFSPIGWSRQWWGHDERIVAIHSGVLVSRTMVVPHARVQSVHWSQGPLARRLGIADAKLDTTEGFFNGLIANIDQDEARAFVLAEMDRCRLARTRPDWRNPSAPVNQL